MVWDGVPLAGARATLRAYVKRVRHMLAPEVTDRSPGRGSVRNSCQWSGVTSTASGRGLEKITADIRSPHLLLQSRTSSPAGAALARVQIEIRPSTTAHAPKQPSGSNPVGGTQEVRTIH